MNRRSFLQILGASTAGLVATAAFDPERALWVPGKKRYFDQAGRQVWPVGSVLLTDASGKHHLLSTQILASAGGGLVGVWDGREIIRYGPTQAIVAGELRPVTLYNPAINRTVETWWRNTA